MQLGGWANLFDQYDSMQQFIEKESTKSSLNANGVVGEYTLAATAYLTTGTTSDYARTFHSVALRVDSYVSLVENTCLYDKTKLFNSVLKDFESLPLPDAEQNDFLGDTWVAEYKIYEG